MGDQGLREALEELCDEADIRRSVYGRLDSESIGNGDLTTMQIRGLLAAHPAESVPRGAFDVAYNIVNQIADVYQVPVDVRQATNDRCWEFAAELIAQFAAAPGPVIDREALVQALARSFHRNDNCAEDWDGLEPIAVLAYLDEARLSADAVMKLARPMPTRGQIAEAIEAAAQYSDGLLVEGHAPDFTEAVLELLNGSTQ